MSKTSYSNLVLGKEQGATILEVAITCPVFFFIVFFFLDCMLYMFQVNEIQFALDKVARVAAADSSMDVDSIRATLIAFSRTLAVELGSGDNVIRVCSPSAGPSYSPTNCEVQGRGYTGQPFTLSIKYRRPSLVGLFAVVQWRFSSSVTVRNENYT